MHVTIDARLAYYRPGGIGRYAVRLAQYLPLVDGHNEYTVLHMRADRRWAHSSRPRPVACLTPCHHPLERWALSVEVARLHPDVHHTTDFIPPARGYRRSVITVHDLNFLHYPQFLTAEARRYYIEQIAWAVRRADAILTDAQVTVDELRERLDVPEAKARAVWLAADPDFRPYAEGEAGPVLARYGLASGYLLFVGTLEPRKNLAGLLAALQRLRQEHRLDPILVVVGAKGWLMDGIARQIAGRGLEGRVRFLESIGDADLPALYNGASVLALPSFYEGFGLPPLEAMACGTPVVVSDRGSLPEIVGDAGSVVGPEDTEGWAAALARLLTDSDVRTEMRRRGLGRAAQFSWEETARKTAAIYQCVYSS